MRGNRGVTLIELSIALAIVALVAMLAFSNLFDWIRLYDFQGFQREVLTQMNEGRTRSIATQRQHRVVINMATMRIALEQGNAGAGSTAWTEVRSAVSPPRGSSVNAILTTQGSTTTTSSTGTVTLVFNPGGDTFPVDLARIRLSNTLGNQVTIRIFGWTAKVRLENGWT